MPLYAMRMSDGNCLIVAAETKAEAENRAHAYQRGGAIVSCREITTFAAEFTLSDEGELKAVLRDTATLAELHANEYPMLAAALSQSYEDFNSSVTDSRSEPVLFDGEAQSHRDAWAQRDRSIVLYSVLQERQRFSN
jgi:hypothetical protein